MQGSKLILSPLDNAVTYNGKDILQTEESEFYIEGVVHAKRHTDAHFGENVTLGNADINMQLFGTLFVRSMALGGNSKIGQ